MLASLNPASPQSLQRLIFKLSPMISSISQQSLYMSRIELAGYVLTGTFHPGQSTNTNYVIARYLYL